MSLYFDGTGGIELGGPSFPFPTQINLNTSSRFSIVAWFCPEDNTSLQTIVELHDGASSAWSLTLAGDVSGDPIRARIDGTTGVGNQTRGGCGFNVWNVASFNLVTATSAQAFVNRGASDSQYTNMNVGQGPPIITQIGIGTSILRGANYFKGYLAHLAIYNIRQQTNSYLSSVAAGYSPASVWKSNLVAYWPLTEPGPQFNLASPKSSSSYPLPINNTGVRYSNWNPPVKLLLPQKTKIAFEPAAQNNSPIFYHHRQQQGMAS